MKPTVQPGSAIEPELSVVVTVVDGGAALERCLGALLQQSNMPAMEVIVPYDDSIIGIASFAARFPAYSFLHLGPIGNGGAPANAFEEHVLFDRRRTGGLLAARGSLIAMLEDRGWPRPDWARSMVRLHRHLPHGAIGGAVECAPVGCLRKAVFFCDFGRYEAPLDRRPAPMDNRPAQYLSDINICYKKAALRSVQSLWEFRYQEAQVHWELRRKGCGLLLSSEPRVVQQREPITLRRALVERIHWGRTFGRVRGATVSRTRSLLLVLCKPLVPALLLARLVRKQSSLGRRASAYVPALPAVLLLAVFWSIGEAIGELEAAFSGSSGSNQQTVSMS